MKGSAILEDVKRRFLLPALLACRLTAVAEEQKPQEPPEEDESLRPKEYAFNPLQAAKELKVGDFYFKKGKYKAAALRFEEASKWDPNSAEAFLKLAESREKLKDAGGASQAYRKYLELAPDAKNADSIRKKIREPRP